MELQRLTRQLSYRIEAKPEGGFVARCADPGIPPLEAPTREELQQKIRQNLDRALAAAFPGFKLPLNSEQHKFQVHIVRKPGGAFSVHSTVAGTPPTEPANSENSIISPNSSLALSTRTSPIYRSRWSSKSIPRKARPSLTRTRP
jgi:hypothetical protein